MPLGIFSNKHLELVYTKYEVNRSIIKDGRCIQPFRAQNPVFSTLTMGLFDVQGKIEKSHYFEMRIPVDKYSESTLDLN